MVCTTAKGLAPVKALRMCCVSSSFISLTSRARQEVLSVTSACAFRPNIILIITTAHISLHADDEDFAGFEENKL